MVEATEDRDGSDGGFFGPSSSEVAANVVATADTSGEAGFAAKEAGLGTGAGGGAFFAGSAVANGDFESGLGGKLGDGLDFTAGSVVEELTSNAEARDLIEDDVAPDEVLGVRSAGIVTDALENLAASSAIGTLGCVLAEVSELPLELLKDAPNESGTVAPRGKLPVPKAGLAEEVAELAEPVDAFDETDVDLDFGGLGGESAAADNTIGSV